MQACSLQNLPRDGLTVGEAREDPHFELLRRLNPPAALSHDGEQLEDVVVVKGASRAPAQVLAQGGQKVWFQLFVPNYESCLARSLTIHFISLAAKDPR